MGVREYLVVRRDSTFVQRQLSFATRVPEAARWPGIARGNLDQCSALSVFGAHPRDVARVNDSYSSHQNSRFRWVLHEVTSHSLARSQAAACGDGASTARATRESYNRINIRYLLLAADTRG